MRKRSPVSQYMGQTKFWENEEHFTDQEWVRIKKATTAIVHWCVANGTDIDVGEEKIILSDQFIVLRGGDDDLHETFVLRKYPFAFAFCNTSHESFEFAVDLILLAMSRIAPKVLMFSSESLLTKDPQKLTKTLSEIFSIESMQAVERKHSSKDPDFLRCSS